MFSPIWHEGYKALFLNSREALRGKIPHQGFRLQQEYVWSNNYAHHKCLRA